MSTSYPTRAAGVNPSTPRPTSPAPRSRNTATFTAYYWEAYNQIVQPHRWDWYLVDKWLPDLGPEGFAVVKVLRSLCYFNPKGGELRDTCQLSVDELAEKCGMKRSTLYKVLDREAVKAFVQRVPDAVFVEGRTRRLPPQFRVCMDNPIHPDDWEEYDRLRGRNEMERAETDAEKEEKRKSKIEIYDQRKSTIEGRKSKNDERKSTTEISYNKDSSLPPVSIPIPIHGSAVPDPLINPPKGEAEAEPTATLDPLVVTWNVALGHLAETVNKPTLETHFRALRLVSISPTGEVRLAAPSEFTRAWVATRHQADIEAALALALGTAPAAVHITQEGK